MSTQDNNNLTPLPFGFEPAVPLPVIPPSDEGQRAVCEMNEHYSPSAVDARVAAIEKEATELRRINQGEVAAIEKEVAEGRSVHERLKAMNARLEEFKALRDQGKQ